MRKIAELYDKNHIGYDEYEELVLGILRKHYKRKGKRIIEAKSGKNNLWIGQSGCQHQIDVSVELEDEIVLAECKCLNKAVDLPLVLTFLARIIDIKPTDPKKHIHGIMFSNLGFQGDQDSNIMKLAEYYHDCIELQVVYSYGRDA